MQRLALRLMMAVTAVLLVGPPPAHAIPDSGFYKGTLTTTVPRYLGGDLPVKSVFKLFARIVHPDVTPGRFAGAIQAPPTADLARPANAYYLFYDPLSDGYAITQESTDGTIHVEVVEKGSSFTLSGTGQQRSFEGSYATPFEIVIKLKRVGPLTAP